MDVILVLRNENLLSFGSEIKKARLLVLFLGSNVSGESRFAPTDGYRANHNSNNSGRIVILKIAGESRFL